MLSEQSVSMAATPSEEDDPAYRDYIRLIMPGLISYVRNVDRYPSADSPTLRAVRRIGLQIFGSDNRFIRRLQFINDHRYLDDITNIATTHLFITKGLNGHDRMLCKMRGIEYDPLLGPIRSIPNHSFYLSIYEPWAKYYEERLENPTKDPTMALSAVYLSLRSRIELELEGEFQSDDDEDSDDDDDDDDEDDDDEEDYYENPDEEDDDDDEDDE